MGQLFHRISFVSHVASNRFPVSQQQHHRVPRWRVKLVSGPPPARVAKMRHAHMDKTCPSLLFVLSRVVLCRCTTRYTSTGQTSFRQVSPWQLRRKERRMEGRNKMELRFLSDIQRPDMFRRMNVACLDNVPEYACWTRHRLALPSPGRFQTPRLRLEVAVEDTEFGLLCLRRWGRRVL